MHVVVIGAGEVGFDVARMLSLDQHDVTVVDIDGGRLEEVRNRLDVLTVHGNGTAAAVLEEAGVREADMLLAVTSVDEVNVLASMIADRLGVETTVARVRSGEFADDRSVLKARDLGIDLVIHPEESAAAEVVHLVRRAGATDVLTFADEKLHLVGMRLEAEGPVVDRPLKDIMAEHSHLTFRVMAISRGVRTILPRGDEVLKARDQVFVLADARVIPEVTALMGKQQTRINNVIVLGGTQEGEIIARRLDQEADKNVKLVEPDRAVAHRLSRELPGVLVLNNDVTDIDFLTREGMGEMDAFIAVTDDEESNLVTCLLAKHLGVFKTVALLSKPAYIPISQSIGLDAAVSTKLAVSREIMRFLRGKHVLSVATVHGLDAEIIEIEANEGAPITRAPLKNLKLPSGVLIGTVIHDERVDIATGTTHIRPGDRVIGFVMPQLVETVESYFG